MEEQKQELLKLIDNLDWEKINSPTISTLRWNAQTNRIKNIIDHLKECQKKLTIEQQLEGMGFSNGRLHYPSLAYYIESNESKFISLYYDVDFNRAKLIHYHAVFDKQNINEILSFAKYLKELEEKDDACAV